MERKADGFSALAAQLKRRVPELEIREYEPMALHTSFRIGGPVRLMALPQTPEQAKAALELAQERAVVPFFLGNGSNLLVADRGYEGFAVKLGAPAFTRLREDGGRLRAGAGTPLSRLSAAAWECGLTGLEFAQGIPGTVGGAVFMNAGAYGGEIAQVLSSATVLELDGSTRTLPGAECGFGYRKSVFSSGKMLILEAAFALEAGDKQSIKARMDQLAAQRRAKQPLELPSAGSTFKRPEGHYAAALIEQCGLKGASAGGAQVSEKHAGFVVNRGGATAQDVRRLMDLVRETVLRETGVALEPEVRLLGFEEGER